MDLNKLVTKETAATLRRLKQHERLLLPGQSFSVIVAVVNDDTSISEAEWDMLLKLPWLPVRAHVLREIREQGSYDATTNKFDFWGDDSHRLNRFLANRGLPYRIRSKNFVLRLVRIKGTTPQ